MVDGQRAHTAHDDGRSSRAAGRRLEVAAGLASLAAAAIHGAVAPAHFAQWWGYGLFFAAALLGQATFGLLMLTRGTDPARWPWHEARRPLCLAGALGNAAIIAVWVVSRTWGVPLGPEAGEVEAVGVPDAVSKVLEAFLVVALLVLARRGAGEPRRPSGA